MLWATSAFGLGTSASALFLARYIDRLGAAVLRLALALFAAALLAASAAPAVSVLIAAQLVAGLACGVALPAIYASAAAISPGGRESRTIGVVLTGWTVSMVAGVALSALIADFLDWRLVFLLAGLLAALISARLRRADLSEQISAKLPRRRSRRCGCRVSCRCSSPAAPSWPPSTASTATWATTSIMGWASRSAPTACWRWSMAAASAWRCCLTA